MRVLMFGWEFPPYISGGLGIACHGIVTGLTRKGIQVSLVLPHVPEGVHKDGFEIIGCNSIEISQDKLVASKVNELVELEQIDTLLHPYMTAENYDSLLNSTSITDIFGSSAGYVSGHLTGKYGPNLIAEVMRYGLIAGAIADKTPHDVIHVHDWMTVLAGIEARRHSKKPLVYHVHALEYDRSGEDPNKQVFAIEQFGLQQADRIIAISEYSKNIIVERYDIDPNKISIVHNGIYESEHEREAQIRKPDPKMVLFLGRVTYQKGPWYFIETAKKVLEHRDDVEFVIAGQGDLLKSMIERVAHLQIGRYVHFTGFLNQDAVSRLFRLADVYVMPSVSEPFGLTCLEAASNEVPMIISKHAGAAEVLQNGLKADFWDTKDMAAKILALLEYPVLREELAKKSKQELQHLTWDDAAPKIIDIYSQVTEKEQE